MGALEGAVPEVAAGGEGSEGSAEEYFSWVDGVAVAGLVDEVASSGEACPDSDCGPDACGSAEDCQPCRCVPALAYDVSLPVSVICWV